MWKAFAFVYAGTAYDEEKDQFSFTDMDVDGFSDGQGSYDMYLNDDVVFDGEFDMIREVIDVLPTGTMDAEKKRLGLSFYQSDEYEKQMKALEKFAE